MKLTSEQIDEFKKVGYLVVPNLIDKATLENWRAQVHDRFGDLTQPANQKSAGPPQAHRPDITILKGFRFTPQTQLVNHPKVKAIIEQMGGGQLIGEDGNLRLLWPEPNKEWALPDQGHIDGYVGKRRTLAFLLGLATYVYDVEPRGGGTAFWPGSHIKSHEFLKKHPQHLERSWRENSKFLTMVKDIHPVELYAKAGDVIFWHCNILHETTHNASTKIRHGLFARLSHKDQESFYHEIPDNLWKRWAI